MTQINLATARQLCTVAEYRVVQASSPRKVSQFDAATLKKHTVEARRLRDKWRDLAQRQRRSVHKAKGGRVAVDSTRSAEKEELFAQVLARFEAAVPGAQQKAAPAKPTKGKRLIEHRQTRATVRKALSQHSVELRQKSKNKSAATTMVAPKSAKQEQPSQPAPKSADTGKARKNVATALTAVTKDSIQKSSQPTTSPLKIPDRFGKQLRAQTAAKQSRIQRSGLTTRIRGHVSARGKRAQGRRDARG